MNWIDEGALYSQIGLFLREDLGRGDITTQSIIVRNTRARARFVAGENMIVAGLEAAEEVFLTLDSQQQLEAFVSDGEAGRSRQGDCADGRVCRRADLRRTCCAESFAATLRHRDADESST